jgi:signal transduction histidine kinase
MTQTTGLTRLTPLIEEAVSVAGEGDLGKVLRVLVADAMSWTKAPYAALGVIGEHGVLSEFIYEGMSVELAAAIGHPPMGRGVLGTVIRERRSLVLDSIAAHPDSVGFPANHPPMNSFLGVPIAVGDEIFGNLYLTDKDGGFTTDDLAVVEALSRIAGAAINTARLQSRLRRLAVIEDRQRIARDLHDSVIQDLFAVGLNLQGLSAKLDDPEAERELNSSIDTLDDAVTSLRRYIFELKQNQQPSLNLDERLQQLTARMGMAYPSLVVLGLDNVRSGPWDDEVVHLATEALSNALRHSRAANVEIDVTQDDSGLTLDVADDGVGFDVTETGAGMGLANMRARALALGGSVEIDSEPGRGTRVRARLPFRPSEYPD